MWWTRSAPAEPDRARRIADQAVTTPIASARTTRSRQVTSRPPHRIKTACLPRAWSTSGVEIWHLAHRDDWEQACSAGAYRMSTRGATLDQVGFIHASRPDRPTVGEHGPVCRVHRQR